MRWGGGHARELYAYREKMKVTDSTFSSRRDQVRTKHQLQAMVGCFVLFSSRHFSVSSASPAKETRIGVRSYVANLIFGFRLLLAVLARVFLISSFVSINVLNVLGEVLKIKSQYLLLLRSWNRRDIRNSIS